VSERVFVAVELPSELRHALGRVREEQPELTRALRWARPEGLHITLRFLGDATQEQVDRLVRGISELPDRPRFSLVCRGLGTFGSLTRPRVLWAGVGGDLDALASVQADVERMCVRFGWPADEQRFTPHITLARARGKLAERDALAALLDRRARYVFSRFAVSGITLYASRTAPGGAVYTPLTRRPLGEDDPPL
jgi:2'-5' RNA ligase